MTTRDTLEAQEERAARIRAGMTAAQLAYLDASHYEVEHVACSWDEWRKAEVSRVAACWELAPYGRDATMFTMSGYWRRPLV